MFLTNLSLKRPVFATVIILALVSLGIISFVGLSINDYPEVEFPYVAVTVVQQGASPEQVETKIARKLEEAIGQISGVKHIYTVVREGVATVFAEFTLETSPDVAAQDVRDKIGIVRGDLPQDIEEPVIARFDPSSFPIISLALTGNISQREMTSLVDDVVKKRLETINGVGNITVYGAQEREIQINLDKDKLAAYGIATAEVLGSLRSENMEVPGGKVSDKGREITLRAMGEVDSPEEFANLPVARRDGVQIYVRDIATVVDGVKEMDSFSRYQGRPAIGIDIVKQSGANTVELADKVTKVIEELKKEMPPGVNLEIVKDNSIYIRDSVNNVVQTIVEGGILAVIMVFLFLRDWRSTMIGALAIPTSVIATFFAMKVMGFTLNFMSLMALSLSVGLLIDDSIVVIENIVRHMRMGKTPLAAAREATAEIGLAVTATTLTVVAVFIPVGMMTGVVGQFFKQFGITVVFAVMVSLLVSFTLVPLLASRFLKNEEFKSRGPLGRFLAWFNRGFDNVNIRYAHFLEVVLRNRWKTMGLALLLFVGSLMTVPMLGSTFMSASDIAEFTVEAELDSGLNLDAAGKMTDKLEGLIRQYPEVTDTYSTIRTDKVNIYVKLVDKKQRDRSDQQIAADMRQKLHAMPGIRISIVMQAGLAVEKTVQFRVLGSDTRELQGYAERAQRIMESIPGAVDVGSSHVPGKPEGRIQIKQAAAADLGVSAAQVGDTLRTLFNGVVVSQFEDDEDRVDVRVRLGSGQRRGLEDLDNIYLTSSHEPAGGGRRPMIALSQVTEQSFATAPSQINRFDRSREIVLSCNLNGISLGEFNKIFEERVKQEIKLPPGYSIIASGESERMGETFTSMGLALITAVLFIFFILSSQFESYIDPFSIMLSLPMAIVGAIFSLLVLGSELSIMSMIGIIMLMGLVTKNAILLVDFTKQRRAQGMERTEAILAAGVTRLRPIIMTTLAMIFSMIPLALGLGLGAEGRAPMAHAIIGGLITSTLLTLVVVPVMYTLLDDLKNKVYSLTGRLKTPPAGAGQ